MIDTGSVYDPDSTASGHRVLVMRLWPRGIRRSKIDLSLPDLGPSVGLLQAYETGGLNQSEFTRRYRAEMAQQEDLLRRVKKLERQHGVVRLLCWERIPRRDFCHTLVLKQILEGMPLPASNPRPHHPASAEPPGAEAHLRQA